ncbi:hypothetical protein FBU30_004986 [Linnemannia zychae]|nr:hypothetical protein FBU30_004986 [Linnemannia zychae]
MVVQHCDNNNCGRDSPIRQKSSSYVKYSPLRSNDNNSNNIINNCAVNNNNSTIINNLSANEDHDPLDMIFESLSSQQPSFRPSTRMAFIGRRVEYGVYLFSKSNRNSTRWRLLLAMTFWLSYVIPVTLKNEARDFNPSQAAPSFDIHHPEWLCPPTSSDESSQNNFEDYWQEYLNFHQEMVLPEAQGGVPDNEKRFLIFQPSDDGLGNRLQALLSSVVMAMITRRAIILDWLAMPQCNANFTDLFQQPENLAWDLNSTLPLHKEMPTYKSKPEIWYPYCRNCALRSPITPESTWSTLLCDADLGLNASAPIIQIFSTQWFLPVIQHNRHWKRELCNMFPHGGKNAFQILAQKLLKPSRVVQDKIDSVMDRIPKDATLIGLQVRRTENNAVGQAIEDSFLSCAADVVQEEEMKPGRSRMNIEEQYNYDNEQHQQQQQQIASESSSIIQTGHNLRRDAIVALDTSDNRRPFASSIIRQSLPKTPGQFAYYLATDYRPTRAHFQEALGDQLYVLDNTFQTTKATVSGSDNFKNNKIDNNISAPGTESGHQNTSITSSVSLSFSSSSTNPSQTEAVVRNSVQGVQTAVAEMFLLAQSDRIISSPYSTFGYFAHGYANIQPNIVKRDGTCIQRRSTQPCFQYWFGFANGGAKCTIRSTIEMSEDYDCWL